MRGRFKKLLFVICVAFTIGVFMQFGLADHTTNEFTLPITIQSPPFLETPATWTDSVLASLTSKEKIGQMFMVASYPKKGEQDKLRVAKLIKTQNVGGVIIFQGTPQQVADLTKYFQSISKVPLIISIDGEWGLSMRLKNSIKYPKQMMLGAITDEMLIYDMGKDIAQQLKHIGVHANFAPVVDVNNNAENPVINSRSFGELRANVARKGILYMKGMQDEGVLAFAKHFPGHGDTKTDSHYGLPVVNHSVERLDSLELYPFRALINAGVGGVMIAHMNIPSLDDTPNLASTLSAKIVDSLLIKKLSFRGLIVTDAMNMKGVSGYHTPVKANLMAVQAGNDILLMPANEVESIAAIQKALETGVIDQERINVSCKKILKAKEWLFSGDKITPPFSMEELHKDNYYLTRKKLIEASLTVVKNDESLIPFQSLDTLEIAHVKIGPNSGKYFKETLDLYKKVDSYFPNEELTSAQYLALLNKLSRYNMVIVSLHSNSIKASSNFNVNDKRIALIDRLMKDVPTLFVGFVNPYVLSRFKNLDKTIAIVESYENDSITQSSTAQMLYGAIGASGRLPVSINARIKAGMGFDTPALERFKYVSPYEAGFNAESLKKVDSLVANAISEKAMPGCQVFAARDGKVFFNKSYGFHTYQKQNSVDVQDVYDLASLTKISATLPSVMRLHGEKKIDIDKTVEAYLPLFDTTDKKDIILSDLLLHQSGLAAWIPFFWETLEPIYPNQNLIKFKYSESYPISLGRRAYANKHIKFMDDYYHTEQSLEYPLQVAENMFIRKDISDSIWTKIATSPLGERGHYKYSDLGFYMLYKIVEETTQKDIVSYVDSVFYRPLGASSLSYIPKNKYDIADIVPTENDLVFRKQIVHGHVHDPGAAMLGGVCGHAGLFGNANDLGKLMQVYLNGGRYGGVDYLNRKLIEQYTSCVNCENGNRRGLGFDKPQPDSSRPGPGFKGISSESFGHTGFTGTMAWADPTTGILYIFLSNRVYPDAVNDKLVKMDVRTNIQKAIYDSRLSN